MYSFFPFRVVLFVLPFIHAIGRKVMDSAFKRLQFLSVNPLIYVAMSKNFRNSLLKADAQNMEGK